MSEYAKNLWWWRDDEGNLTVAKYVPVEARWYIIGDERPWTDADMSDWEKIGQVALPQVST